MLLSSKDGIKCDTCGMIHKNKFTYYSCSGTGFTTNGGKTSKNGVYLDFDMCDSCYYKYTKIIKDNIKDAQRNKIKDDFTTNFYDNADWMKIILTKVDVDKNVDGGISGTTEDIDIVLVDKSLKDFIRNLIKIKKQKIEKEEESWSME